MMDTNFRTIKQVAELAGVSVRTLHHYDEIGLLKPEQRSESGYRLYGPAELDRLQEILAWRALGFALAEVRAMVDDPNHDRRASLERQRALVVRRRGELRTLQRTIDDALAALARGETQEESTMFDGTDHEQYAAEAQQRWGGTPAYEESRRRTATYGPDDWAAITQEASEVAAAFAELMEAGVPAASERAATIVERHRTHIDRWFYPLSPSMHLNLAELYVADPRFTASWDEHGAGLAHYVHDAIRATHLDPR